MSNLFKTTKKIIKKVVQPEPYSQKWLTQRDVSIEKPILIGGSGRSGTTLLSAMLNAHPSLFCGDEFGLLTESKFSLDKIANIYDYNKKDLISMVKSTKNRIQFLEVFMRDIMYQKNIKNLVTKDPGYIFNLDESLILFPNLKFIHICRDGRDVAVSMRKNAKDIGIRYDAHYDDQGLLSIQYCAKVWRTFINTYRRYDKDSRCYLIKYEDLVTNPEYSLKNLCQFLNLEYNSSMLEFNNQVFHLNSISRDHLTGVSQPLYQNKVKTYQKTLTNEQIDWFNREAEQELKYLGYD